MCHARACGLHDPETPGEDEGTGHGGLGRVGLRVGVSELWVMTLHQAQNSFNKKPFLLSPSLLSGFVAPGFSAQVLVWLKNMLKEVVGST